MRTLSLKIDVCTHEGLHRGVPRLLDVLRRHRVRATFCLAFGPDNSGRAIRNVFKPGFLRKMVRTGAPSTYGLRTMLSGTLLPARPIASGAPDLVARIDGEGHEVALHGWDHRRWQDDLRRLSEVEIRAQLERARDACAAVLGRAPSGSGAPGWIVTPGSLRAQDALGLAYASDLRGGVPCRLRAGPVLAATPQFPTTGPCIEELLAQGVRDEEALYAALTAGVAGARTAVFPVHAEIEGRAHRDLFDRLLPVLADGRDAVLPLCDLASRTRTDALPLRDLVAVELPGRAGAVASSSDPGTVRHSTG